MAGQPAIWAAWPGALPIGHMGALSRAMAQRPTRWRTGRAQIPARRRRSRRLGGVRWRDLIKLLLLLGLILYLGLGEPLRQLDAILGYFGFH
ncbi:MAG: hypothetical protein EOO76_21025 [Novosphingobium sp.]|nr:MAG: hypothetical protein EOO76_21025 [Novosphingobium sp.]